jgi:hypothetical protein
METLSHKIAKGKRPGGISQVIECLPSKNEALSSNSSIIKIKRQKEHSLKSQIQPTSPSIQFCLRLVIIALWFLIVLQSPQRTFVTTFIHLGKGETS